MGPLLHDNHGRIVNYLRLAITDRCNLRCVYCMPEDGIRYLPKKEVLTYEELLRITGLLAGMGISKVRITGGEPFVRNDLMKFLRKMVALPGLKEWHITTNGVLTAPYVDELVDLNLSSVNLSIDTLDPKRFFQITRRDELTAVRATLDRLLAAGIPVKINAVVMDGQNTEDIRELTALTARLPLSVRFIEEMPFNGTDSGRPFLVWDHHRILHEIRKYFPELKKIVDPENSTASNYEIPGHLGAVGIIAGFSRTFCGTCNRLRITAQGMLKTCLYDGGVLDLKRAMRSNMSDTQIEEALLKAIGSRARDGFEAERHTQPSVVSESMSTIGG